MSSSKYLELSIRIVAQVVISLVLLTTCLYLIISQEGDPKAKNWAYAMVGSVVTFWFKK